MRLFNSVLPPFECGAIWSTTSLAPSCGVCPQYWQAKPSLFRTWKRNFNVALRLLGLRSLVGFVGNLANLRALPHLPNRFSYMPRFGKPSNLPIPRLLTKPPNKTEASCNLIKRVAFDTLRYFELYLVFIKTTITGYTKKVKSIFCSFFVARWTNYGI